MKKERISTISTVAVPDCHDALQAHQVMAMVIVRRHVPGITSRYAYTSYPNGLTVRINHSEVEAAVHASFDGRWSCKVSWASCGESTVSHTLTMIEVLKVATRLAAELESATWSHMSDVQIPGTDLVASCEYDQKTRKYVFAFLEPQKGDTTPLTPIDAAAS